MRRHLIVVDMQRDFLLPDGKLYIGHDTTELQQKIADLMGSRKYDSVFCTMDLHAPSDPEFALFPPHCVLASEGAELVPEIGHYKPYVLHKASYGLSRGAAPLVYEMLQVPLVRDEIKPDLQIDVVGVCTHICVYHVISSVLDFYRAACTRAAWPYANVRVRVLTDCVDDFNPQAARQALDNLQRLYGVELVDSKEVSCGTAS